MWILPRSIGPLLQLSSAQVTQVSISDSNEQSRLCASSLLVRSKQCPLRTWSQKWKRDSWTQHLSGRILKPSLDSHFVTKWTSLWPAIPASPLAPQVSAWEGKILATCGPMSANRSSSCSQGTASLRTSTGIFLWDSMRFSRTCVASATEWKTSVAKQRGEYSQRLKSARLTSGNGCLSSPSGTNRPTTSVMDTLPPKSQAALDRARTVGGCSNLREFVHHEGTFVYGPHAPESHSTAGSLRESFNRTTSGEDFAEPRTGTENWPTATSNMMTGAGTQGREGGLNLQTAAKGKLNPRWVETLMGLPIGWTMPSCEVPVDTRRFTPPVTIGSTSCACLETGSCRQQRSGLGEPCGGDWRTPVERDHHPSKIEGRTSALAPTIQLAHQVEQVASAVQKAWATPTALNLDESYYQRSGDNVYPGLAKQVRDDLILSLSL